MVQLGIDFGSVMTYSSLQNALVDIKKF
ncbi:hypothetical protein DFO73_116125 [Cytobacillus oceanisediminis]|uniref:Uncharacterized protein n=1 Tax=Cytobacillus oceanisediminis TaxID=665099 RepID=A0A2V2ZQ85_9BACI|nr:hypothetical protein DFO73_12272 [Cytobacillus oceanisediminis]PWW20310.1 hypothetical protein DFO73_116125 [Cytobacillus oceanisediminis]